MRALYWSFLQKLEPRLLDLTDLLLHDLVALQITIDRRQRVRRDWLAFGRA
jgi:hypothetical protein